MVDETFGGFLQLPEAFNRYLITRYQLNTHREWGSSFIIRWLINQRMLFYVDRGALFG
jgi:hypothetical protein